MTEKKGLPYPPILLLLFITLIGAILRFYYYSTLSLFNDELSALTRLRFNNFHDLIHKGVMTDMHPAGIQVFLYFLTKIFGNSEAVIRLPFVLAGIISIPMIFLVGKKWFSDTTGFLAAASIAVLQYPLYFSQMARPYSMGMMASLVLMFTMTVIIQSDGKKGERMIWYYAGFIISGAACMYIHYFSFLFAAIAGFSGLFLVQRRSLPKYLLAGILMIIMALPHFQIYRHQLMVGGLGGPGGWLGPPGEDAIPKYLFYVFNESGLVLLFLAGLFIFSFVYYRKTLVINRYHTLCLVFFVLPILIAYYYSILKNPVFQYSILIFSFPFLILFLFSFFPSVFRFKYQVTLALLIMAITGYSTVIEKAYYRTEHYGVFRELAEKTIEINQKFGDQNISNTINVFDPYYINYYFEKFNRPVKMLQYRCMEPEKLAELRDIVNRSTTPYFLRSWSNIYEPPEAEAIIMKHYPFRILHQPHFNSAISLYSRSPNDSAVSPKVIFTAFHDFETIRWPEDQQFLNSEQAFSGNNSAALGSYEYGNTYQAVLKDIGYKKGAMLQVNIRAYSEELPCEALLVATIQDMHGNAIFWQAGKFDPYITKSKSWQQIFFTCTPTGNLNEYYTIKIFPWNTQKKKIWVDDLEIKLIMP